MSDQSEPTRQVIVPLDPDSPRGRQVAAEWSELFIKIRAAIARRKAESEQAAEGAAVNNLADLHAAEPTTHCGDGWVTDAHSPPCFFRAR